MINSVKPRGDNQDEKRTYKTLCVGMAAGSIVVLLVIFNAGWVVTTGSANAKAREIARDAVLERLVLIAVAQFMQDPNKEERLKELKKRDSYGMNNKTDYAKKQG